MRRLLAIGGLALAGALGLALLGLVILVGTGTLKAYTIPSSAMEPTLRCAPPGAGCEGESNDRVLVLTRFVSYERGDVVVFDVPPPAERECGSGGRFVKRIVGLPGERLELRAVEGRAHVFVDGTRLDEPYLDDERRLRWRGRDRSWSLGDNSYFVLGDNRAQSCDSTLWGPLDGDLLQGEVVATYWPPGRISIR